MKTIILAAGEGKRLHPLTLDKPKTMLEVGGRTLIERALEGLHNAGIGDSEILILSGHKAERLRRQVPGCNFIHNEAYDSTNNIYSLWLARNELAGEDFLLLNSDVLFAPKMVEEILLAPKNSSLLVDDIRPLEEEEMRVAADTEGRITAIAKTLDIEQSAGEYIGLARFGKDFSQALFDRIDTMIAAGQTGVWYENAIAGILGKHPLYCLSTHGLPWIEIDTHEDIARAAEIAREIDELEV